jgi:hypothetical protein
MMRRLNKEFGMSIFQKLEKKGLLNGAPACVLRPELEIIGGSLSYGVSGDSSDMDVVSVCIPSKEEVFPHLNGRVPGFGPQIQPFQNWQRHHIKTEENTPQFKEYDLTSYSITEFFRLAADNNPNIIDALFVPDRCVVHKTDIGAVMRDNRRLFLHKGSYQKFKGYAYSSLKKISTCGDVRPETTKLIAFELANNIPHTVELADINAEIERRGLHKD